MKTLDFIAVALSRVLFHEWLDEDIKNFLLAAEDFGATCNFLVLEQLLLGSQELGLIAYHFRVQESASHADLALFSKELFDLAKVVSFESAERLPWNFSVGQELPFYQKQWLKWQTVKLTHLLDLVSHWGPGPLQVHTVQIVTLNVKWLAWVTLLRLLLFEEALEKSLYVVLENIWIGKDLVLCFTLKEQPREFMSRRDSLRCGSPILVHFRRIILLKVHILPLLELLCGLLPLRRHCGMT